MAGYSASSDALVTEQNDTVGAVFRKNGGTGHGRPTGNGGQSGQAGPGDHDRSAPSSSEAFEENETDLCRFTRPRRTDPSAPGDLSIMEIFDVTFGTAAREDVLRPRGASPVTRAMTPTRERVATATTRVERRDGKRRHSDRHGRVRRRTYAQACAQGAGPANRRGSSGQRTMIREPIATSAWGGCLETP